MENAESLRTKKTLRFRSYLEHMWNYSKAALSRPSYLAFHRSGDAILSARSTMSGKSAVVSLLQEPSSVAGAAPSRGIRVSLPRRLFLVREVVLPGANDDEIDGMIRFELSNLFPVAPEELVWDWHVSATRDDGYSVCRVIAVDLSTASESLRALGLQDALRLGIEPSTVSIANLYLCSYGSWPDAPTLVVVVTRDNLDMVVIGPQGILCDRAIAAGGESPSVEALVSEIDVLLSIYGQEPSRAPLSRLLVLGDVPDVERLAADTGLPSESFSMPQGLISQAPSSPAEVAAAVGAALGPLLSDGIHVNIADPVRAQRDASLLRVYLSSVAAALVLLVLGFATLALFARAHRMVAYLARLQARASEIAPEANAVDAKRERLAAIERQLEGQGRVLDVLMALYKVTPPDVYLTSVEINSQGIFVIKGHAQQLFRASEYAAMLDKETIFGRPSRQGPIAYQRTESGKTFISFTITRDLRGSTRI